MTVAFLASRGQTRVRLTAKAASPEEAAAMIAPEEEYARNALGDAVYGADDDTLEGVVVSLLRERDATIAVAESLTAGLLGADLSKPPGASEVFVGGFVTYATRAKVSLLGVPQQVVDEHGVVSDACAAAMAEGARDRLRTTYGVALTGVAGPAEQEGKPVGTVHVGVAGPAGTFTRALRLPGDRALVRLYSVVQAENLLRLHLIGAL